MGFDKLLLSGTNGFSQFNRPRELHQENKLLSCIGLDSFFSPLYKMMMSTLVL